MILLLDNYDSFTYNLAHLLYAVAGETLVKRNREITVSEILSLKPDAIVLSPGPGRPENAGIMVELIQKSYDKIPIFGVCLGHQAIGYAFGTKIIHAKKIMHGKISAITHDQKGIFQNIPSPCEVVRYHSLAIDEATLPSEFIVSARSDDGEIMAIRHQSLPIESIQYHPESIMTTSGKLQVANFFNNLKLLKSGGKI